MKIHSQNYSASNVYASQIEKRTESKPIFKPNINSAAYKVDISQEAQKYYHSYIQEYNNLDNEKVDRIDEKRKLLSKSVIDAAGLLQSEFHSRFTKENTELKEKNGKDCSQTELSKNCFDVYANLYDEIKSGYTDGSREIWVVDASAEGGFRQVTEEEELNALDSAYDFYAQIVDAYGNSGDISLKVDTAMKNLQLALKNQRYASGSNSKDTENEKAEHIYDRMRNAAKSWKDNYSNNKTNVSLLIKKIFDHTVLSGLDT